MNPWIREPIRFSLSRITNARKVFVVGGAARTIYTYRDRRSQLDTRNCITQSFGPSSQFAFGSTKHRVAFLHTSQNHSRNASPPSQTQPPPPLPPSPSRPPFTTPPYPPPPLQPTAPTPPSGASKKNRPPPPRPPTTNTGNPPQTSRPSSASSTTT